MAERNPKLSKSIGKADTRSRAKADAAKDRAEDTAVLADSDSWPRGVEGQAMVKIVMTAAELIPTGQYANVSVGPAQITAFVDQARVLAAAEESYFSDVERDTIAKALNELAEIVEGDVLAVQRNLILENLQDQVSTNGK